MENQTPAILLKPRNHLFLTINTLINRSTLVIKLGDDFQLVLTRRNENFLIPQFLLVNLRHLDSYV